MGFAEELQKEMHKLRARRQELVDEIGTLDTELKEFEVAEKVAKKLGVGIRGTLIGGDAPTVSVSRQPKLRARPKFKGQISKLALHLLNRAYPTGMKAGEIRREAAENHETHIKSTSLTVALGRHKAKGAVRLDSRAWYYVPPSERRAKTAMTARDDEKKTPRQSNPARRLILRG